MKPLPAAHFPSTHWSLIAQAVGTDAVARDALTQLVETYQAPLRAYLCARYRIDFDTAQGVLHDFIVDKFVLKTNLMARADADRGRFRYYLRRTLDNYCRDRHRSAGPSPVNLNPDDIEHETVAVQRFDEEWACETLANAILRFRDECLKDQRPDLWEIFHGRVLAPAILGAAEIDFPDYVRRFGFHHEKQAQNLLVTATRRFRRTLKGIVEVLDDDPQTELADLKNILAHARSVTEKLQYLVADVDNSPTMGHSSSSAGRPGDGRPHELFDMRERELHSDELHAIFHELLEQPISVELERSGPAARLAKLASAQRLLLKGLGDLLAHPRPPLELLEIAKDFAKAELSNPDSAWPLQVSHVLYLAALSAAHVRCGASITLLDAPSQVATLEWACEQTWVPESLRQLFSEHRRLLLS